MSKRNEMIQRGLDHLSLSDLSEGRSNVREFELYYKLIGLLDAMLEPEHPEHTKKFLARWFAPRGKK